MLEEEEALTCTHIMLHTVYDELGGGTDMQGAPPGPMVAVPGKHSKNAPAHRIMGAASRTTTTRRHCHVPYSSK